jgi:hypothetical protein
MKRPVIPMNAPALSSLPRCQEHRYALLTSEGDCVTCSREAYMRSVKAAEDARDAIKAAARASGSAAGKRGFYPKMRGAAQ